MFWLKWCESEVLFCHRCDLHLSLKKSGIGSELVKIHVGKVCLTNLRSGDWPQKLTRWCSFSFHLFCKRFYFYCRYQLDLQSGLMQSALAQKLQKRHSKQISWNLTNFSSLTKCRTIVISSVLTFFTDFTADYCRSQWDLSFELT